jgi:hypothetical protein
MGNNGRFSDGFLMGAVVGGAVVFLLGTEKGNKVLKLIMEEGRASLSDLMDEIEEYKEEAKEVIEMAEEEIDEELAEEETVPEAAAKETNGHAPKTKPSSKRFFRKSK